MSDRQSDQSDATIRPIARPRSEVTATAEAAPATRRNSLAVVVVVALLLAGLLGVFLVLPDEPEPAAPAVTATPEPEAEAQPALSDAERSRLDALAQRDLAALLTQQDRLRTRGAEDWGGEDWAEYLALARAGDDAYLAGDFAASAQSYAQALEAGAALLDYSEQLFDTLLADAEAALAAADWMTAESQFSAALAIDEQSVAASDGLERARALPDVLASMQAAAEADANGDLPAAIELYREALRTDPQWAPARAALADASSRLAQFNFERTLAAGYSALTESRFQDALESFDAALAMRPDSQPALDGRFQAEEGLRLGQLALARVRATAFERRELWQQAIEQYESALETDPTLEYALEGLERSRARYDLEIKVLNLLDNPRLLFDDGVLNDARTLREEVANVEPRGTQIDEQLERLDRLIAAATREYPVVLRSDGLTNITVYRVGTIGAIQSTEISLRPGTYTAIGSRNGYRDVRTEFTVLPGEELGPIDIVCTEPI